MRPANIVTAFADILAGSAAALAVMNSYNVTGFPVDPDLFWLLLSTFGLYGGGIVFNDVFDAKLDSKERPERAIPSGRISKAHATLLGIFLFVIGIVSAFWVNPTAGLIATGVAICALIYDAAAKHHIVFGPLVMGSCRGGNLMLGASLLPTSLSSLWFLPAIPIIYIAAITLISRGEVHGGSKAAGYMATAAVVSITMALLLLFLIPGYDLVPATPFALLFGAMVIPAFVTAASDPAPRTIKKAVKRGVISLIILNSAIAAGFLGVIAGLIVLVLLPLSYWFSKLFAVT